MTTYNVCEATPTRYTYVAGKLIKKFTNYKAAEEYARSLLYKAHLLCSGERTSACGTGGCGDRYSVLSSGDKYGRLDLFIQPVFAA